MNPYMLKEGEILQKIQEAADTYTFKVRCEDAFKPGQYNMLYYFGIGEAPISVAGYENGVLEHTIRAVGEVTNHIDSIKEKDKLYIRGPYGNFWDLDLAKGKDLVFVAGGLGLAALKWAIDEAIKRKSDFKSINVFYGAKDYNALLYKYKYKDWENAVYFNISLDKEDSRWDGFVGLISSLIKAKNLSKNSIVFMCGPDPMVKASVLELLEKGISLENIYISMERHMKCSLGTCGHCMFGPFFVCKDGPIFQYSKIKEFFERKEV